MPRGDRTGPMGMGPMTGRGAGFCSGFAAPGYANPVGYGRGLGGGRGFRRMFYATGLPRWARYGYQNPSGACAPDFDEKERLTQQATLLEDQLRDLKRRLAQFEAGNTE